MVYLIDNKNINEARKQINKFSGREIIALIARDDEFNRKMLETGKINILVFSELLERKDRLKQRDSGLNQVLCKIAGDNNVAVGIDFKQIAKLKEFELSSYLAKIMQNIKLCRKYQVKIVIINIHGADLIDLKSFLLTLGMPTDMAKYAVENSVEI